MRRAVATAASYIAPCDGGGDLGGPEGPSRLDEGTKLESGWHGRVFPDAGEAVIYFVSGAEPCRLGETDPEEVQRIAASRARRKVRRYCRANRLYRLATLTYSRQTDDYDQVVIDVRAFIKRLRAAAFKGKRFPYVWVIECHKSGKLHVHLALPRYVDKRQLAAVWGKGFVDIRALGEVPRSHEAMRDMAKAAALYLAKYVEKTFADGASSAGRHRYEVGQGFQPVAVEVPPQRAELAARNDCIVVMGGEAPAFEWSSDSLGEAWKAPPIRVIFW